MTTARDPPQISSKEIVLADPTIPFLIERSACHGDTGFWPTNWNVPAMARLLSSNWNSPPGTI